MPFNVMMVFGTRPEAIKMAPLARVLREWPDIELNICSTGQHREMLQQVLTGFGRSGDVHTRQQLVDDLDLAARACAVAQLVDLGGHGVQEGLGQRIMCCGSAFFQRAKSALLRFMSCPSSSRSLACSSSTTRPESLP